MLQTLKVCLRSLREKLFCRCFQAVRDSSRHFNVGEEKFSRNVCIYRYLELRVIYLVYQFFTNSYIKYMYLKA